MINLTVAYLGLGANLGDPIQQLIDARTALYALDGTEHGRCSSFYLSSPVGYDEQPDFINCVLELTTRLDAYELLDAMQAIEVQLGRTRVVSNQNAPRLIDIDLLLFGHHSIRSERLNVPHPRMQQRLFVLKPLLELNSQAELNGEKIGRVEIDGNQFGGQFVSRLSIV